MLEGDYWKANQDVAFQAAEYFNTISKDERELMANSKNIINRGRNMREIDFTEDFRKKFLSKEYGHYEKYEKNKVSTVYDEGAEEGSHDKFY